MRGSAKAGQGIGCERVLKGVSAPEITRPNHREFHQRNAYGNLQVQETKVKKYCNFCGAPLKDSAKECEQCGWDRSQDGAPSSDPADTKARIGVAAGLIMAYVVVGFLLQGAPDVAGAAPVRTGPPASMSNDQTSEPTIAAPAVALSVTPTALATTPVKIGTAAKLLSIKIADVKLAHIKPHDALDYGFVVPETDQKCQLVGQLHGTGGYDQDLETFLLTEDEYIFWHANTSAIPHSSWETRRGSETTLAYDLPGSGSYHLVISNAMSPTDKSVAVKALVKCARS
jgi:hypothetical protein